MCRGGRKPLPRGGRQQRAFGLHWGNKAESATRNSFDVSRIIGSIAKRLSQLINGCSQTLFEIDECISRPYSVLQFFARDHFPGLFQELDQKLEGLLLQANPFSALQQFARRQVELKRTEAKGSCRLRWRCHREALSGARSLPWNALLATFENGSTVVATYLGSATYLIRFKSSANQQAAIPIREPLRDGAALFDRDKIPQAGYAGQDENSPAGATG